MLTFYISKKYKKSGQNVANVQITGYSFSDQHILSPINPVYPQKDHNGKRPQWKKSMGIKTTVYSKTA